MKTLGLLGGLSWRSTAEYYRLLNEGARSRLGSQHSAKIILYSFDFQEMTDLKKNNDWQAVTKTLTHAALALENAGAQALMICSNTMHRVAADVRAQLTVPIIDIVDATAQAVVASGCRRPILLGTLYTLTSGIFSERLKENHKIDTMMPDESARKQIHQMIYSELCNGEIRPRSKQHLLSICQALYAKGADGVILGCTELTLILTAEDFDMPVFDTTKIHASAALDLAIM